MGYRQVQISVPYFTNIPKDVVTNVLHFGWGGGGEPGPSDLTNLKDMCANFIEQIYDIAGGSGMAPWCSPALTRVKIYDLAALVPRVPELDLITPLTVKQDTSSTVATETAVCLSLRGAHIPGTSLASERGRVFIGGIGSSCIFSGTGADFPRPSGAFTTNIKNAAAALVAVVATTHWQWVVYSRKHSFASLVMGGFIDNALDTQRRRGNAPTARVLWP